MTNSSGAATTVKHRHKWKSSTNHSCPQCDGLMQYCEDSQCPLYRCIGRCKKMFSMRLDRRLVEVGYKW
jgi:hypothetical protein